MVTFGVDAHKRTHTIVAVDEHGTTARPDARSARPARIISACCAGPRGSARSAAGRSRTAGTCPADWSGTCSRAGEQIVRVPPKLMAHVRDSRPHLRQVRPDRRARRRPSRATRAGPAGRPVGRTRAGGPAAGRPPRIPSGRTNPDDLPAALASARARPGLGAQGPQPRPSPRPRRGRAPARRPSTGLVARLARELTERCAELTVEHQRAARRDRRPRPASWRQPARHPRLRSADRRQDRRRDRRCRPVQVPRRLRPLQRHRAAAGVVVEQSQTPAQPHRQPPTERRVAPHRAHPGPLAPTSARR